MNFYLLSLLKTAIVVGIFMHVLAYLQWIERKVIAHVQLRVGPRRVGPHGLLQPLADVIKLVTKEDILPSHVNKVFYFMAPFIAVTFALISISIIPFGPEITVAGVRTNMGLTDLNIGVLFILGISGLGVYGVALAGWPAARCCGCGFSFSIRSAYGKSPTVRRASTSDSFRGGPSFRCRSRRSSVSFCS